MTAYRTLAESTEQIQKAPRTPWMRLLWAATRLVFVRLRRRRVARTDAYVRRLAPRDVVEYRDRGPRERALVERLRPGLVFELMFDSISRRLTSGRAP